MDLGTILALLLLGLIVGALARLFVPGTSGMGLIATMVAGIGGAVLAGLAVHYLVDPTSQWVTFLIAVLCAALLVAILSRPYGPRAGY